MNMRIVSGLLGYLTLFTGAAMVPPLILAAVAQEVDGVAAFLLSIFLCVAVTFELERFGGLQGKDNVGVRDGIAITGLGWLMVSILGTVPYLAGGYLNLVDSLVESFAGFSGTGATVFADVEILPRSILLWRSLSNWVGGLGIVVIFMAILSQLGRGAMFILRAETTGPTKDRQMPRIRDNAKALFRIYVGLTAICAASYFACGLDIFTAVNHAMTTIATGGYGVYNSTVGEYGSAALEYCMAFFMIVSSGSFAMYAVAVRQGVGVIFRNAEFKIYLWIVAVTSAIIAADLFLEMNFSAEESIRGAVFHVASLSSTTGFVAYDFDTYPPLSKACLMLTMFLGGCAGSTAGGLKVARIILLFKFVSSIVKQKLHPQLSLRRGEIFLRYRGNGYSVRVRDDVRRDWICEQRFGERVDNGERGTRLRDTGGDEYLRAPADAQQTFCVRVHVPQQAGGFHGTGALYANFLAQYQRLVIREDFWKNEIARA